MTRCCFSSSSLSQPVDVSEASCKLAAQASQCFAKAAAKAALRQLVVRHDDDRLRHLRQTVHATAALEEVRVDDEHGLVLQVSLPSAEAEAAAGPVARASTTCSEA